MGMEKYVLTNKTGYSPSEVTPEFRSNAPISLGETGFWPQVSSNPFFTAVSLSPLPPQVKVLSNFKGNWTGWLWCDTGNSAKEYSSWSKPPKETPACRR